MDDSRSDMIDDDNVELLSILDILKLSYDVDHPVTSVYI